MFTPKGDVKALPKGAMPDRLRVRDPLRGRRPLLGRARQRHDRSAALQLRNGDTVEIITCPNQKPNKDWLKFVMTARAQTKIRYFCARSSASKPRSSARELLERSCASTAPRSRKAEQDGRARRGRDELQLRHRRRADRRRSATARSPPSRCSSSRCPSASAKAHGASRRRDREPMLKPLRRKVTRARRSAGIKVAGEDDVLVRFAKCCSPLPGDPIVGFITRGRGVTVHRRDCDKALDLDPERRSTSSGTASIKRRTRSRSRCCAPTSRACSRTSRSRSPIRASTSRRPTAAPPRTAARSTRSRCVGHLDQLKSVIRNLDTIQGVVSATRL